MTRGRVSSYIIPVKIIGITGGIGSGKSLVSKMIRERGFPVVDLDKLAHEIIEPGKPAYEKIVSRFGGEILDRDRRVERRKLAAVVFSDAEARKELEAITHPEISRLLLEKIEGYRSAGTGMLFLEIPLLFETGMDSWIRPVIAVKCPVGVCLLRLEDRDGFSVSESQARMKAQMDPEEKARRADFVIDNSGSLEETRARVEKILNELASQ
ncbi:MAG: dephospho-CoA kinase [bacterium]|nr:dephospho-CoA kinase [bacterium]